MSTEIFKVGDPVFDIRYGWGTVVDKGLNFVNVSSGKGNSEHYKDYELMFLSFTEYDLINGGWSQDRSVLNQPKKGQVVYVKDHDDNFWVTAKFHSKNKHDFNVYTKEETRFVTFQYLEVENPLLKEKE